MCFRCLEHDLPGDEQRRLRVRRSRLFLSAGLGLNTLAYVIGRFAPSHASNIGDFIAGMLTGLALVFMGASLVLMRTRAAR